MSTNIVQHLQSLKKKSNVWINPVAVAAIQNSEQPRALVESYQIANARWVVKPRIDAAALSNQGNCSVRRKVRVLSANDHSMFRILNDALLGGASYPILTAALGVVGGAVAAGAGLIFTVATTAIGYATTSQRLVARAGDEIWHVEEIGKEGGNPVYVSAFFIQDPYRAGTPQAPEKGWLIHEERKELFLG